MTNREAFALMPKGEWVTAPSLGVGAHVLNALYARKSIKRRPTGAPRSMPQWEYLRA